MSQPIICAHCNRTFPSKLALAGHLGGVKTAMNRRAPRPYDAAQNRAGKSESLLTPRTSPRKRHGPMGWVAYSERAWFGLDEDGGAWIARRM